MRIIHVLADGTTKESIEGMVIQNEQFYQVLRSIIEKREAADE